MSLYVFMYTIENQGKIIKYWIKYSKEILNDSDLRMNQKFQISVGATLTCLFSIATFGWKFEIFLAS